MIAQKSNSKIFIFLLSFVLCSGSVLSIKDKITINEVVETKKIETSLKPIKIENSTELKVQKSRTLYHDDKLKAGDIECNVDLLEIFDLKGDKQVKDSKSLIEEKMYCRRNKRTCCSEQNIISSNVAFAKGAKALKEKFQVIEEFFTLFRGPLFSDYVIEHNSVSKCTKIVEDLNITIAEENFDYFTYTYQHYMMQMIENLLMDTELYVKKNLWFYGDIICSICNPTYQENFNLSKEGSKLNLHTNTCSEMMEEREYEKNILHFYSKFVEKTTKFVECISGLEEETEEEENENEKEPTEEEVNEQNNLKLIPLDKKQVDDFNKDFSTCWYDQNVIQLECSKFCSKSLRLYEFPIDDLLHNYKVSLHILYEALTTKDISEFYEQIKELEWKIGTENDPIAFFALNSFWQDYKIDTLTWSYHSSQGLNVYKEIMSKKYLDFEGSNIMGVIVTLLMSIFLWK